MIFHKHKWIILDKTIMPSAYEQLKDKMTSMSNVTPIMFTKKLVFVFQCENKKCKAIRVHTESNPEL